MENKQIIEALSLQSIIIKEKNLQKLMGLVVEKLSKLTIAERSSLFIFDHDRMVLESVAAQGANKKVFSIKLNMGLAGTAFLQKRTINISSAYDSYYFNHETDLETGYQTESVLAVPIFSAENLVIGVLQLLNNKDGRFNKEHEELAIEKCKNIVYQLGNESPHLTSLVETVQSIVNQTEADRGTIFKVDLNNSCLKSIYATNLDKDICLSLGIGIAGHVVISEELLLINDVKNDARFNEGYDKKTGFKTRNILAFPLFDSLGELIGVIEVINKLNNEDFKPEDIQVLQILSQSIAMALENSFLIREQKLQFKSVLEVLASTIDAKDHLTSGHSIRVKDFAVEIGNELGLSEQDLDVLEVSALLHDYGKIGVKDNVLKKEGKLSQDEFKHIQTHVDLTRKILGQLRLSKQYKRVPVIAASHHEYLDGSGYTSGLEGYEVPYLARILTVADVFEALTADRHYRKAMTPSEAFSILEQGAGTKFDKNIVSKFKIMWQRKLAS